MKYSTLENKAGEAMQYDALALSAISSVWRGYLPWTNSALRPSAVQVVLNDILLNKRKVIVELGSGLSTVFISSLLAQGRMEGRLVTVDSDPKWLEEVRGWLPPEAIARTTFVHAPFADNTYESEPITWYDAVSVGDQLRTLPPVDLLLVDGPPAYYHEHCLNRGPALEVVRPFLAPAATIILDDINRSGELHIARRWSEQLGTTYRDLVVEAGIAIWSLGPGNNICQ